MHEGLFKNTKSSGISSGHLLLICVHYSYQTKCKRLRYVSFRFVDMLFGVKNISLKRVKHYFS